MDDEFDIDHTYSQASGPHLEACHALAYRFPAGEGFRPERGDSWIVANEGEFFDTLMSKAGWFTSLWRSEAGKVYVTDADGFVYRGPGAGSWPHETLRGVLTGVWGLNDEHVYAWGQLSGDRPVPHRFDGTRWASMAAPEQPIVGLHGVSPDLLFAVGDRGFIARWDGGAWATMASPDKSSLSTVFAVGPDEVYAGGHGGSLHQGSVHGWTNLVRDQAPISAVVHWKERVWVATLGELGLCVWEKGALESIKPNLQVTHLDARHNLLFTTSGMLGETEDGESFSAFPVDEFSDAVEEVDPLWE